MARMTPDEWRKKKEEQKKQGVISSPATSYVPSETSTSGESSRRMTPSEWKAKKAGTSFEYWAKASIGLLNEMQDKSKNWSYKDEHSSYDSKISNLLSQADNWRNQYAGNEEAVSYINSVVSALSDTKRNSFYVADHYSKFDTQEDYDFWETRNTPEKRQQLYTDNLSRIDDLESFYDEAYAVETWYNSYQMNPDAWDQETVSKNMAIYNRLTSEFGSLSGLDAEIQRLKTDNTNYMRGNYNEKGLYYGSKVVDDYQEVTKRANFTEDSAYRDYDNPTRDELTQYDAMQDSSTWYYDANNVLRDAYGNEIVKDSTGHLVNPMAQAQDYAITDRLGMFLNATEKEREEYAGTIVSGTWGDIIGEGVDGSWEELTEGEIGIYYALLKNSPEEAYKYLKDMKTELNRRATQAKKEQWSQGYDEANFLEKIALNVATTPAQLVSGVVSTIEDTANTLKGEEINPYSAAHGGMHFSQTVRGKAAEDLDATGFKIPIINFTLGDLYQTGMSILDSWAAIGIGGGMGGALLATNAAASEATRLYEQGASIGQIAVGSAAAGAAEMVFESLSIEKLINMKDAKTVGQWIKNVLVQGGIEASEEGFTEIANILTNAIIMGNESDWAKLVEENDGDLWKAFLSEVQAVAHASLSGFFSGVGSASIPSAISYGATQNQFAEDGSRITNAGGVDALMDLANWVAGVSNDKTKNAITKQQKTATKRFEKNSDSKRTAKAVGRLYDTINTTVTEQNRADIAAELEKSGMSSDQAIDIVQRLMGKENSGFSERNMKMAKFNNAIALGTMVKEHTEKAFTPEGKYKVSDTGKATVLETEVDVEGKTITKDTGEVIDIKGVASIRKGEMLLDIGDGKTINAKNVAYANKNDALIYEAIANLGDNIDAKSANRLIAKYNGGDAMVFARGMAQAYSYGFYGIDRSELTGKHTLTSELTEEQRNFAYGLGEQYRPVKDVADKAQAQKDLAKSGKTPSEKGVYYRDKDGNATDISTYLKESNIKLNDAQKTGIEAMRKLSAALGVRFNVFESWVENGKRYYLDENGMKTEGNPNGFYDTTTGEIYIDLNAGNDYQGTILFTVAHELTHFMRQWSPEHFTKIASIVFKHGGMKGNVSELIALKQAKAKAKGKPISYDTAMEEVVADGMETILKNGKVVEFMAEVKQKDRVAWEKIKGWFKNLAKFLRKMVWAYRGQSAQTTEGAKVAEFSQDLLTQIERIFAEGVVASGDNYSRVASIVGQVNIFLDEIMALDTVSTIDSSNETPYAGDLKEDENSAKKVFKEQGGFADRPGFGRVVLGRKGVVNTVFHGNGPAKQAAFPAIKAVIENGIEIGRDINHKGRGYDTVTFAAPIDFFQTKAPLGVVVQVFENGRGNKSFYIHEIFDAEGNYIELVNGVPTKKEISNTGEVDSSSTADVADDGIAPTTNIHNDSEIVNSKSVEAMDVEVDAKTESVAPTVLKSERTWTESDYVQEYKQEHNGAKFSDRYGDIREVLAKKGLDELSKRYGNYFPLSAGFDQAMRADKTPLTMHTVKAKQVTYSKKLSIYKAARNAFITAYGVKTSVHIQQMGIDAMLYADMAKESVSKAIGKPNEQSTLDAIPRIREILSDSVLMGIERIAHTGNKGTALYGYRLYNLYWYDDGQKKSPNCLVCTVVQSTDSAEGYVFHNIENVTVEQDLPGNKTGMPPSLNSNTYTVAQLYKTVKRIDRGNGGLKYADAEREKYLFNYTERNDGVKYQDRADDSVSNRSLLANAFEGVAQNDIEKQKIQEYKSKLAIIEAEEQKLRELNEQIKELSFAKGPRDTKKIKTLRFDAVQAANRISTYDKQLLRLEASKPLQDVLNREKRRAYKKAEDRGKEALAEYKARVEAKQKETTEKWRESRKTAVAKARETAEKRDARAKLQKLVLDTVKWISYPAKTDVKCPDILKQPYADFLNGIDLSSKRLAEGGDPTKNDLRLSNAMDSLATALDKVMTSQDPTQDVDKVLDTGYLDLPANFVGQLRDMTENIKSMMVEGEYVVNTMTAAEVRQLSQMIRTLNHAIKTMSKLYANLRFANVEALGVDTMEFMDALGEIEKTGGMKDFVEWDNALPFYAFKRFGKGGESVFEGLMDAQDKLAFLAQEIFNFRDKAWTGKEASEWSEDTHTIKLPNGNELTLTTADAMSIYCLSRRDQGLQHLLGGGARVMGIQEGSQKAKDSRSLLTIEDIDAINSSLTDRQKEVAESIQEFMSTVCSEWGNEISMKRFLTKEFNEKFYFPIESNDENLPLKDPAAQQSDLFRLLNISATKPLTKGANNEVIIRNIFDVFTGHASDMARLNAFGMGLLDYMKWLNYREKTENDEGQINVRGVRKAMQLSYGNAATSYVLNLVKDVNGRFSDGGDPNILMKWMRAAKTASVGSSVRVATLQITSYPRAALVISPKSLALGLTKIPNIAKAKKYCGIALWKSFGFYDTNISRSIEDQMKGVTDIKQKLIELSLKGAEWGDAITWGALWNACEYEVAKTTKNKVGSEEFYQEVGKKLREVVYRTQVVDSTLTRSQIMRSKRGMAQEAAAFMSEPTLSANILMDAGFEFNLEKRRTGSAKAAWKKTGAYIGRAVAVYSIGQLTAALMEALWDAWRDDEDEEFGEKYADEFVENLVLDLVPFNKIPIVSDIFEGALSLVGIGFYSSDKMSSTWLTQAVSAVDAWKKVFSGESSATTYNALYKTTRAVSSFYGASFSGLMREAVALWNNTAGAYDPTLKILNYNRTKTELGDLLLDAIIEGNAQNVDSIKAQFDGEKDMYSAVRSAIKNRYNDGEIDYATAKQYLIQYGGMEENDAYWKAEEWKFEDETGDDFGKYDDFFVAVETGKNIKTVIKTYTDNGVTESALRGQITEHFKPIYTEMSKAEKAGIKGYLLNAYELCGMSREDAEDKIAEWQFEADHPELVDRITFAQYKRWETDGKPKGVSIDLFINVAEFRDDGTSNSVKSQDEVAAYISSVTTNRAERHALWCCFYKASTSPWR